MGSTSFQVAHLCNSVTGSVRSVPQLYADGALSDDLDIVSELAKEGELADALHFLNSLVSTWKICN